MNNMFLKDYSELIDGNIGIVDAKIDYSYENEELFLPINDLFYGMFIDSFHTERMYDLYSSEGEYKRINKLLDEKFFG